MAFDPDKYLKDKEQSGEFNPDEYLSQKQVAEVAPVQEEPGQLEALARGAEQGLTFGFGDELNAALEAATSDKPYQQALEESRQEFKSTEEAHPYTTIGGNLLGSIVPGGLIAKGIGAGARALTGISGMGPLPESAGAIKKLAQLAQYGAKGDGGLKGLATIGALTGATEGALQGAGATEDKSKILANLPKDVMLGSTVGGIGGAGVGMLGKLFKGISETSLGSSAGDLRQLGKEGTNLWNKETLEGLGREAREGLLDVSKTAKSELGEAGAKIGKSLKNIKDVDVAPELSTFSGDKASIQKQISDLVSKKQELAQRIINEPEANIAGNPAAVEKMNEAKNFLNEVVDTFGIESEDSLLKEAMGDVSFNKAVASLSKIDHPATQELKDVSNRLNLAKSKLASITKEQGKMTPYVDDVNKILAGKENDPEAIYEAYKYLREEANALAQDPTAIPGKKGMIDGLNKLKNELRTKLDTSKTIDPTATTLPQARESYSKLAGVLDRFAPGLKDKTSLDEDTMTQVEKGLMNFLNKAESETTSGVVTKAELDEIQRLLQDISPTLAEKFKAAKSPIEKLALKKQSASTGVGLVGAARTLFGAGAHATGLVEGAIAKAPITKVASKVASKVPVPTDLFKPGIAEAISTKSPTLGKMMMRLQDESTTEAKRRAYQNILLNNPIVREVLSTDTEQETP